MCKHYFTRMIGFMTMRCESCGSCFSAPQNCWGLPLGTRLGKD